MICIIFTIFFLAKILIIISFTFPFRPRLQLLNYLVKLALHLDSLKSSGKLTTIRKKPDSFETVRKIEDHLEISGQL